MAKADYQVERSECTSLQSISVTDYSTALLCLSGTTVKPPDGPEPERFERRLSNRVSLWNQRAGPVDSRTTNSV
jgi:hypothetical protein